MKIDNQSHGDFSTPGELRIIRLLPGSVERVWSYLVDPEKRSRWLARGTIEPRVGGTVRFEFHNSKLSAPGDAIPAKYVDDCPDGVGFTGRITRWEPPRALAHTWVEADWVTSEVTYELTPQNGDALLVVTHRRLGTKRSLLTSVGAGWHTHLSILLAELSETPQPSFWSTHTRLERDYEKLIPADLS